MVAVFGSVPMPGFKDHDRILPLPINVPPMLNVNPVRKSHQSAMAFVPYGPRLSGGYNRSGNQVLCHKHGFQNAEHAGDGNHFNPPIIMNPHAIEFIPGQLWVLNSLPAYSLAVPVHTNGYPSSPDGALVPYNCFSASPNSIPKSLNGFLVSPNFSLESSTVEVVENKDEIGTDEDAEKPSLEWKEGENLQDEENEQEQPSIDAEKANLEVKQDPSATVEVSDGIVVAKEICSKVKAEEKPTKRWGDYSE